MVVWDFNNSIVITLQAITANPNLILVLGKSVYYKGFRF